MKQVIPAVIFAGGRSSRMGQDKALLPFGSSPSLASYQYDRLRTYFTTVYLSSKTDKFDFDAPVITDCYTDHSPLAGIVSIFETLDTDAVFILSVDAPFVSREAIDTLISAWKGEEAVVARNRNEVQPLCGLYTRAVLPVAKEALQKGQHKLKLLLRQINTGYVDFNDEIMFLNLNHPSEYERAQQILHTQKD